MKTEITERLTLNQYERANAVEKVDGYYLRICPTTTPQAEFLKAQAECAHHLRAQLAHVESLTFAQFSEVKKIVEKQN